MNRIALTAATLACAFTGWWLPALGQRESSRRASRIPQSPGPTAALKPGPSLAIHLRRAGSAMAQFHAVVAAVKGGGAEAFLKDGMTGLTSGDAEELAAVLAGEQLGRSATDGPSLLRSFKDMDYRAANAALAAWAEDNPDAALRTMFTLEGEEFRGDQGILQRLAERDPAKALEILRAAPASAMLQTGWRVMLAACAEKGPDIALAAVQSAPDYAKAGGLNDTLRVLARTDPQAALTWMEALPADLRSRASRAAVFRVWARADPAAALSRWMTADSASFASESGHHFDRWSREDPDAALRWIDENPSCQTDPFMILVMRNLAGRDPQRATGLLDRVSPEHRSNALSNVAGSWPAADFPAAFTWARGLTDDSDRNTATEMLERHVRQLPEAERRAYVESVGAATSAGFGILLELDQPAALKTFATLPAEQQSELWKSVGGDLASHSPAVAAQFLRHMSPQEGEDAALAGDVADQYGELAATWAHSDPAAAATWVESLPPGAAQKWAALNLVANWSRHDPAAVAAWTSRLPPGPAKVAAEEQLATNTRAEP